MVISFLVTASRVRNDRDPLAKFGDGTAATTIAGDLDKLDMVVEIKASDKYYEDIKLKFLKHWRSICPSLNPFTINCKTPTQCSRLNIYISRKVGLCVVDLEG